MADEEDGFPLAELRVSLEIPGETPSYSLVKLDPRLRAGDPDEWLGMIETLGEKSLEGVLLRESLRLRVDHE